MQKILKIILFILILFQTFVFFYSYLDCEKNFKSIDFYMTGEIGEKLSKKDLAQTIISENLYNIDSLKSMFVLSLISLITTIGIIITPSSRKQK
jgi:hypothetical protein